MAIKDTVHQFGILLYPGAQQSAVLGLTDLLETASRISAERGGTAATLQVRHFQAAGRATRSKLPITALILPPSLGSVVPDEALGPLTRWIRARHAEGTVLCSVCAGAFLLAATGLLDDRVVTTHWALGERFAARFPSIQLDTDKLLIDDGDIVTAGGLMAWIDLGLRLVDRYLGPSVMLATARFFLVDPGGREQRFYSSFAPQLTHGDAAILKVQRWLQARRGEKITVPVMAEQARLGERTFLRRFQKATGMTPGQYLQHLRVGKARDLLEQSTLAVDEVAWKVGYEDPGAFRKTFKNVMGLSPGEYRRRFSVSRLPPSPPR